MHGVFHVGAMLHRFAAAAAAAGVLLCQPPLSKMRTNHIERRSDLWKQGGKSLDFIFLTILTDEPDARLTGTERISLGSENTLRVVVCFPHYSRLRLLVER